MTHKGKFANKDYTVKNPQKYAGTKKPHYRSSWELTFMVYLDNNPSVISWASETVKIPYRNPLTGKQSVYVPDFFIIYQDKNNKRRAELLEIKPAKETMLTEKSSDRDKAMIAINHAKWEAAAKWCRLKGVQFRVINEHDIFHQGKKR